METLTSPIDEWADGPRQLLFERIKQSNNYPSALKRFLSPKVLEIFSEHGLPSKQVFNIYRSESNHHYLTVAMALVGRLRKWQDSIANNESTSNFINNFNGSDSDSNQSDDLLKEIIQGIRENRFSMGELAFACGLPGNESEVVDKRIKDQQTAEKPQPALRLVIQNLAEQVEKRPSWKDPKELKNLAEALEGRLRTKLMILLNELENASVQKFQN